MFLQCTFSLFLCPYSKTLDNIYGNRYGGILGIMLYGDPTAAPHLCCIGLVLGAGTLIFIAIKMFVLIIKNRGNDL